MPPWIVGPLPTTKSMNVQPTDVPTMMLGGLPDTVALHQPGTVTGLSATRVLDEYTELQL